jgi:ATP-dependent helicase/nuclease subunit A
MPERNPRGPLSISYRSRPGLVHFSSELFAPAFESQGIPSSRVRLNPQSESEPKGLGSFLELWNLTAKNKAMDAAALAAAVKSILDDSSVRVRDRKTGQTRTVRPSDLSILCRTNETCNAVARELAAIGIRPVLPRQGLLATLEGRAALAALRLWVDDRDTLAAAELARMIDYAGREQDWLAQILRNPGTAAFSEMLKIVRVKNRREAEPNLGVVSAFDAVVQSIELADLCLRWGDSEARLANLEALRGQTVKYLERCSAAGTGCTLSGLITYLMALAENQLDGQGVDEDDHAVVVTTWHKAKGLEWPIVVLFELQRRDASTRALGTSVQNASAQIRLGDPLAGRWIRLWPNPYLSANKNTPFHDRLAEHPATKAALIQADREDLRLLYVGWTRARDRLVLAGRTGKIFEGLLDLLPDKAGPVPGTVGQATIAWSGREIGAVVRTSAPLAPQVRAVTPGTGYVPAGVQEYAPAFQQPSSMKAAARRLTAYQRIGERVGITGDPDFADLGSAVHGFFNADRAGLDSGQRATILDGLLRRFAVRSALDPNGVLRASDSLRIWIQRQWPDARWHREWPVLWRDDLKTVVRGNSDLVLSVTGGLVVIDHKSFPGSAEQALARCSDYVGQIDAYAAAIEAAMGQKVLSKWVHLPVSGIVVEM